MKNRFDELTKALAARESEEPAGISRREALARASVGVAGAVLAAFGMEPAWAAKGGDPGRPGGGGNACKTYCQRFGNKRERDACLQACQSCSSPSLLCGTSGYGLVCCTSPGTCCSGVCTNLATDPNNCSACGASCTSYPQVHSTCDSGSCAYACWDGWKDCDGVPASGCEAHLGSDPNNCGACDNACGAGQSCCGGVCVDTAADPLNCGGCGINCVDYYGVPYCCGGVCTDGTNDANNCGACGNQCTDPAAPHCINGACSCAGTVCGGVCVDTTWDANNCGACGNACSGSTPYCSGGVCTECPAGMTLCDGVCIDTSWDPNNCGGCGVACDTANWQACCWGTCTDYCACNWCGGYY